ncbi:hypothetical protein SAMN05216226_10242 [Halovenus aranensis]|uniref:Uncharacterized protein n=1 Tax=Halovenus aranensis TaxID=890420 RepID=A0A1G8SLZ1_9EURY|nr:hypothetical protein SAMN05216226_10242 [Halovenus aranensis]
MIGEIDAIRTVMILYYVLMVFSLGLWVIRDARTRGSKQPYTWALVSVFTPIGLPYYLYKRYRNVGLEKRETTRRVDRVLATWASASLGAFLLAAVLTPPDPFSQIRVMLIVFLVFLPGAYLLVYRGKYRMLQQSIQI